MKTSGFCEKCCGFHEKHQKQLIQHRSLIWTWSFIEYRGKANWVYVIFWWYLVVHMCLVMLMCLVVHVCVCGAGMVMYVFGDTCGVCICILYMCLVVYVCICDACICCSTLMSMHWASQITSEKLAILDCNHFIKSTTN